MATLDDLFTADGIEKDQTPTPAAPERYARGGTPAGLKTLKFPLETFDDTYQGPQDPGFIGDCGTAPPPPSEPEPTTEIAIDDLVSAPFTYLSGPAGTGKTFLARQIARERDDALLCATTGIAATNLGDVATINSTLGYFNTQSLWEQYASGYLSARLRQLRKSGVRLLIVDETSMLEARQLTVLCQAFDDVNLKKEYDASLEQVEYVTDEKLQMKLLLIGDFAQLPPVEGDFAFLAPEWERFASRTFTLTHIRRQADRAFVEALQAVRKGQAHQALQVLESRLVPTTDFAFEGTTIVAQNKEVDRINSLRHAQLPGEILSWPTVRSGEQEKDWLRLIPESVDLKVGALVMVLANLPFAREERGAAITGYHYVNGDLGTAVAKEEQGMRILLQRTGSDVIVRPQTSEWLVPTGHKKPRFDVKGSVTRMPLRLAYATTCHKSQGLSLDRVQVCLSSWMFGKPSMTYVALSRCRTLAGLRIVGSQKMFLNKCKVDPAIGAFL